MQASLKAIMGGFCKRFRLRCSLRYSDKLILGEINALNLIGSGELCHLLKETNGNYKKVDRLVDKKLKRLAGMGKLETSRAFVMRGTVRRYINQNKKIGDLLASADAKINKYGLSGTIPIPPSKGLIAVLGKSDLLSMMVHESIHNVLDANGINFEKEGLSPLDEGLCVFLHFRLAKHTGLYKKDRSELTKKYRLWASFFETLLEGVPDDRVLTSIKKYKPGRLLRMLNRYERRKCGNGEI